MIHEKTILERLAGAKNSSDLSHKPTRCDVDYMGALGAAGIKHKHGSSLLDADLSQSREDVTKAYKAAEGIVRILAGKRRWIMTPQKLRIIATQALRLYLLPACPHCHGRGYTGVETAKPESLTPCPDCREKASKEPSGRTVSASGLPIPCPTCNGKRYVKKPPEPTHYAPKVCSHCRGSGKRPVPAQYNREIRDVLAIMESKRRAAGLAVKRQMGSRMEVE